jgi:hydroxyacylglutathione hydrolase
MTMTTLPRPSPATSPLHPEGPSKGVRLARRLLPVSLALLGLTGCATSHSVDTVADGITVHTFRRDYVSAFVIARGDDYFMVDAGYEANAPVLADDLRREGFDPARLRAIVLTHGHPDHAGGAGYFRRTFSTPIVAGASDANLLSAGSADPLCPTDDRARDRLASDQAARFTPFPADRAVDAEVALDGLVGIPGTIAPLPGHTPGSLVVTIPEAVFVGDLFRGAILGSSAEVHFYMCDLEGNRRAVRTLLERVAPTATTFFTGHFGPVSRSAVAARFASP